MNTFCIDNIKADYEAVEEKFLSNYACRSANSLGRVYPEEECALRTVFQRDKDRILHSKAFRRLKHKTQVFLSPEGDHYRTRLTHTLEVAQIARTISRALRLNEDLTEAIALGHDLGHTPFGHTGEEVLNSLLKGGFRHNEQSVRVVTYIEDLNLTRETIDGIAHHTGQPLPFTLEGQVVKASDRIAYLNHDIDDALRAGVIQLKDIPRACLDFLGTSNRTRISKMVLDIIENSFNKDTILMSEKCTDNMKELRSWMFNNVYVGSSAKKEEDKAKKILHDLFHIYLLKLQAQYASLGEDTRLEQVAADYIAGMTDRYALKKYKRFFIPSNSPEPDDDSFLYKLAAESLKGSNGSN
ncbi:MAG: deoxyguanosinetriphosphate triphosphohydrolase [Candidatus Gastranaerophilales bacterium]|nr:deoxyguanosinetriphosphate triphosphohydrolase [Candidatus Gastranaerophilales bacterium]